MITHFSILLYIVRLAMGQINGEFWWLSDKLADYTHVRPPPPMFENLNEFDNDESVKIVFEDLPAVKVNLTEPKKARSDGSGTIKWPDDDKKIVINKTDTRKNQTDQPVLSDRFVFKYPDSDNYVRKDNTNLTTLEMENIIENNSIGIDNKLDSNMHKQVENICVFMKTNECQEKNGLVHQIQYPMKVNSELTCCVFPLSTKYIYASPRIYFPDDLHLKRYKRSKDTTLKQRHILLQRRHGESKKATADRIATPSPDYETDDPYWNIKSFKTPNKKTVNKYDYNNDDYEQDYISEIPRPGLVGMYSDHEEAPSIWSTQSDEGYTDSDEYDEVDDDDTFGYSTVDPRRVTKSKNNRQPIKITTASNEATYNAKSQTISYHSKPNFNVFQDFKLLLKNKDRPSRVQKRTTTVDSIIDDGMELLANEDIENSDDDKENLQVFKNCGRTMQLTRILKQDKQIGDTVNGSCPWLAVVVPTRKLTSILCYATVIHPRAVITAAHCIYGKTTGEVTVLAGIWDLSGLAKAQKREASIRIHPKYKHGELTHDLALLHWVRPLELGLNVQPACLADPSLDEECMFYGWGGFDQALKRRPRWQRASVHSCKESLSLADAADIPSDAFCATVVSRNTVTGMGGALMCNKAGLMSAVGVAVARDSTMALLPLHQWAHSVMSVLTHD